MFFLFFIGASISIGWEILCIPCAGFFLCIFGLGFRNILGYKSNWSVFSCPFLLQYQSKDNWLGQKEYGWKKTFYDHQKNGLLWQLRKVIVRVGGLLCCALLILSSSITRTWTHGRHLYQYLLTTDDIQDVTHRGDRVNMLILQENFLKIRYT